MSVIDMRGVRQCKGSEKVVYWKERSRDLVYECVGFTCPPTSHTVKLMFLYSTVSTLNPNRQ
jgi:hypothetical protein